MALALVFLDFVPSGGLAGVGLSCDSVCFDGGYSRGFCLPESAGCVIEGSVHEGVGDVFCSERLSVDAVCCCLRTRSFGSGQEQDVLTKFGGVEFVYANGQRVAKVEGGDVFFFVNDHLGSPRRVLDLTGNVVNELDFLPFGSEMTASGEDFKYTGKELDLDSGLHYYGARYYDSVAGRFITPDTVEKFPNPYVYVANNPMKYIDPRGQQQKSAIVFLADAGDFSKGKGFIRSSTKKLKKQFNGFLFNSFIIRHTANYFVRSAQNLRDAYQNEGYEVQIISGHQSSPIIKSIIEKVLEIDVPTDVESGWTVSDLVTENPGKLVGVIGHSSRTDERISVDMKYTRNSVGALRTEEAFIMGQDSSYVEIFGYPTDTAHSNTCFEIYGCGLVNSVAEKKGTVSNKGLSLATKMRGKYSWEQIQDYFDESANYPWFKSYAGYKTVKKSE